VHRFQQYSGGSAVRTADSDRGGKIPAQRSLDGAPSAALPLEISGGLRQCRTDLGTAAFSPGVGNWPRRSCGLARGGVHR
jgi:hypothetical protein